MRTIANAEARDALEAIGKQVIDLLAANIRTPLSEENEQPYSAEFGRLLMSAVALAAQDIEHLNRIYLIEGVAQFAGEISAVWPEAAEALPRIISRGYHVGRQGVEAVMTPVGSA